ncbi:MAG: DUF1963 domain-containing protein [Lewinellaceae bacterium]|nr:DUF1963 domain-containing protein [Lewinellaceae bacterium]
MALTFQLPADMEPFREQLLQTKRSFIRAEAGPEADTTPWQSKIGGIPYQTTETGWPESPDGTPLIFLAQLNFAEMPALAPFPEKGILQFFISDDDLYGMDFDDGENPDTFRVLFYPEPVMEPRKLKKVASRTEIDLLPHHPEIAYPLQFRLEEEVVPMTDYQFYQQFGAGFFRQFGEQEWGIANTFGRAVRAEGHKVGGYAYFTQDDPRNPEDPMLLLLQIDSDEKMDLMWGDMGVGHFFIREKDLLNKDFSRVLYDWDCL